MFGTSNSQNTFSPNAPNTLLDTSVQSLIVPATGLSDPLQAQLRPASANPPSIEHATSGVFTVGATGKVNFDYLFDGGGYEGEVAIFDLDGMDRYAHAGAEFFAREAALRALTNTDLGHIVISDQTEGARFSGSLPYEGDFNSGTYTGAKTFSMRPGEHFGIMLVPNGKVEDILYNRNWEANQLPLFSVSLANPMQATQFTKLVDTHADVLNLVDGNTFSFEDLRLDGYSDRDYNDIIFQVRGATGDASLIDKVIDPQHDWQNSDVGKKLMSYANVDGKGLTANYYDNNDFTGYRGRRTDASVDFNWGTGAPAVMTSPGTFSIRWTGQVEAQYSEDYTFYTRSDEKVRLWINGQLLVDHWTDHLLTEDSGKISLQAGQKYDIKLEYAEETGDASMKLLWSSSSQLKEIIPQNVLYPDPTVLPIDPVNGLEYRPGELLVKFKSDSTDDQIRAVSQSYGASNAERLIPFNPQAVSELDQWRILSFSTDKNLTQLRTIISSNASVEAVGLDYKLEFDATPDDTSFSQLWGLNNTDLDAAGSPIDADIDAPEAWEIQTGSRNVIVGVLDTGVDYTHPDLAANIWTNPGEIPGDGIDNDGNGYVDDVHGFDFGENDNDPMDTEGHGTHVAGTIGAVGNNKLGVVGVSQNVSLMPLKLIDSDGKGFFRNAAQAIAYATRNGLQAPNARVVLNASIQGSQPNFWATLAGSWGFGGKGEEFQNMSDAIQLANSSEILFVAAAGNYAKDMDDPDNRIFPGGFSLFSPNVITVAATDRKDDLAIFSNPDQPGSNYGSFFVNLGAPGKDIYSTLPGGNYGNLSGTSMAAPHVAGAAALLLAQNPFLKASELKDILANTGDLLPSLQGKTTSGKRLNINNALESLHPTRRVKLTIHRVRTLAHDNADFYPEGSINGSPIGRLASTDNPNDRDYGPRSTEDDGDQDDQGVSPGWAFIQDVTGSTVDINFQLYDEDGGFNPTDHNDIYPSSGVRDLSLTYNLSTNQVIDKNSGNIYIPDANGQIHSQGEGGDDDTAEIWFSITDSVV